MEELFYGVAPWNNVTVELATLTVADIPQGGLFLIPGVRKNLINSGEGDEYG